MRRASFILTICGALFAGVAVFLLLFWFCFPAWWPSIVIAYSPSLRHAIIADTHRRDMRTHPRWSFKRIPVADFSRFDHLNGKPLYTSFIALDDNSDPAITWEIIDYLALHVHEAEARKVLMNHYHAWGEVRDLLTRYHLANR